MKHLRIEILLILLLIVGSQLFADDDRITSPLIMPEWHQTTPWNARCPGQGQNRAHAGSHALALAKTMKYWAYPNQGEGSVSYTDDDFGQLTQNFAQDINWGGMSNTLVFQTTQRFIYMCGVAAYTDYEYDFSSSSLTNVRNAMINHFRYDSAMQILQRSEYTNFVWKNLLRSELDAHRVVIYSAELSSGREIAFIIDGYNEEGLFHINFSSDVIPDAWVELNELSIQGEAISDANQQMLSGIQPSLGPVTISENFEDGFGNFNWQFAGNTNWTISSEAFYYGSHSAKSGNIDNNQTTSMYIIIDVSHDDTISFHKKVSCEFEATHQYDHLAFFIDGVEMQRWSGDGSWEYHEYPVTPGVHEFRWTYSKDGASVYFSDCAWVDAVTFPEGTTPLGAPRFLEAQVMQDKNIQLDWLAPSAGNPGLTGYRIYRNGSEIAQFANPQMTNYTDFTLPNGSYTYYLRALYSSGVSNPSNAATSTVEVPYAPENLTATLMSVSSVELNWDAPPLIRNRSLLGYYLYRDGVIVAELENPEGTSHLDSGLSEGVYYYQVSALWENGESALSNTALAALGVPEPPTNLQALVTGNSVSLSWNQVDSTESLTGFKILRNGQSLTTINDPLQLSYTDAALANGAYTYVVRAVYGNVESGNSTPVNVFIELPYPPANLSATANGDDVQLRWQIPDLVRALTHYFIYRNGVLIAGVFNPATTIYSDPNLANGNYAYHVTAVYSGVESPASNVANVLVEVLYPPRNFSAIEESLGRIRLSWQNPISSPNRAFLGTNIYIDNLHSGSTIPPQQTNTLIPLPEGTYHFEIAALYSTGESARIGTFLDVVGYLEPVSEISHSVSDDNVQLSWSPVPDPDVEYRLFRNGTEIAQVAATEYMDSNLSNAFYEYYIVVVYDNGVSEASPSIMVEVEVLYPPTSLIAEADGNDVMLSWTAAATSGGLSRAFFGYRIFRNGNILNSQPITDIYFVDESLPNGVYQYQVAAVYSSGNSLSSNMVEVEIELQYPPQLLQAEVEDTAVHLSWQMGRQAERGFMHYNVYRDGAYLASTTAPEYSELGLPNATYSYYVTALYDGGESAPSNVVQAIVNYAYSTAVLSGQVLGDAVNLSWAEILPPLGVQLLGYQIWRNDEALATVPDTVYSDISLPNGSYRYYIRVLYSTHTSIPSNTYIANVEVNYPPSNLSYILDQNNLNLFWTAAADSARALIGYNVYRNGILHDTRPETSYSDLNLPNGLYTYYVTAVYDSGESLPTETVLVEVELLYAPTNLSYELQDDDIVLSWNIAENASRAFIRFNIYRNGMLHDQSSATQYVDASLPNGNYAYYVTALYDSGESTASNTVAIALELLYPASDLIATVIEDTVNLSWTAAASSGGLRNFLGYKVLRDNVQIASTEGTSYTDLDLPNGSYLYSVIATYDSGDALPSNAAVAIVEVLYPPTNLSAEVLADDIQLSWSPAAISGGLRNFIAYQVYRNGSLLHSTSATEFLDQNLANGLYTYYVTALYDSGESSPTASLELEVEVLYPPTELSFSVLEDSVNLFWIAAANSSRAFTAYQIHRDGNLLATTQMLEYSDSALANGTYSYYVTAFYAGGESSATNSVTATVEVPYPVTELTAIVDANTVMLSWIVPASSALRAFNGYHVYRNGSLHQVLNNPALNSWNDIGLANGTYSYYLTANYSIAGESPASNTVLVEIEVTYPPENLSYSVSGDTVQLVWDQPITGPRALLNYNVYRDGQSIGQSADPQYTDPGLANGSYTYYVTALYDGGESAASNSISVFVEVPYPATELTAAVNEDTVLLSWNLPAVSLPRAFNGYYIYRNGNLHQSISNPATNQWSDTGVPNGSYSYYLIARYDAGLSVQSNTVAVIVNVMPDLYPPENLTVALQGERDALLNWTAPTGSPSFYRIYRNGLEITTNTFSSYLDEDLDNGSYEYYVKAQYPEGLSSASNTVSLNLLVAYPPTDFAGSLSSPNSVNLSWTIPNQGEIGYMLHRNGLQHALLSNPLTNSYTDSDLANGSYSYQLAAIYPDAISELSQPLSFVVEVLYLPQDFSLEQIANSVNLVWNAPIDIGGLTAYRLYRDSVLIYEGINSFYSDLDLPNALYEYQLSCVYAFGESATTASLSATIGITYSASNLSIELIDDDAHLSWSPVADAGYFNHYKVYRDAALVGTTELNEYVDAALANGSHSYYVIAAYSFGDSEPTASVVVNLEILYPPRVLQALPSGDTVSLSWIAPLNQGGLRGLIQYRVYRNGSLIGQSNSPNYMDEDLANGLYHYAVSALYDSGESALSASVPAQITVAYAPSNLSYQVLDNDVQLSWTAPSDMDGFTEYILYRNGFEIAGTVSNSYLDENLPNGEQYYYVRARYGSHQSTYSNTVTVLVTYPYPVSWQITTLDGNNVHLQWGYPADILAISHYEIIRNTEVISTSTYHQYDDLNLPNGSYIYQIRVVYTWGNSSEPSEPFTALVKLPYAIQNLSGNVLSNDVQLSWETPADTGYLTAYKVYRDAEVIATTTTTDYSDPDLANGTYSYQVSALYIDLESELSSPLSLTVLLPNIPQNVSATIVSENNVEINWDSLSLDFGFMNYELWRNDTLIYEGTNNVYMDSGLANGLYHYGVIAVYQSAASEPSEEATISVIVAQPLQDLSYVVNGNSVTINWQAPEDTYGFSHVEIWRSASLVATVLPEEGTSYIDADLENGFYFCWLRSVYEGGSYRMSEYDFMILVPFAPGNFQAAVDEYSVLLSWNPPADMYYLTGYKLMRNDQVINLGREAINYLDENLPNGTYNYSLQSVYEGPNHSGMQNISVTISQVYPAQAVTATRLDESFQIQWEAPLSLFAPDYYQIHLLPNGLGTPANEWVLLEGNCTELSYLDIDQGGIEHGNFVWAVTAKWENSSGGIPVFSNAIFVEQTPTYTRLLGNYPNPFNPDTNIRLWMKEDGKVSLHIYNNRGQQVRTLFTGDLKAGSHIIPFDGKDDSGHTLSSGMYFSHLKSGKYHRTLKMILSK